MVSHFALLWLRPCLHFYDRYFMKFMEEKMVLPQLGFCSQLKNFHVSQVYCWKVVPAPSFPPKPRKKMAYFLYWQTQHHKWDAVPLEEGTGQRCVSQHGWGGATLWELWLVQQWGSAPRVPHLFFGLNITELTRSMKFPLDKFLGPWVVTIS